MPELVRGQLLIVQEHEGGVAFVWNYDIPDGYQEGLSVDIAGDTWSIASSRAVRHWDEGLDYGFPAGSQDPIDIVDDSLVSFPER